MALSLILMVVRYLSQGKALVNGGIFITVFAFQASADKGVSLS